MLSSIHSFPTNSHPIEDEFYNYDDPEAPPPTANPTQFEADAYLAPPLDKADAMFGGNLVEPATSLGGHYDIKQELVPAETILARQKQEESSSITGLRLLVAAFGGLVIFATFGFVGYQRQAAHKEGAKKLELSFGGGDDNSILYTDTDSSKGEPAVDRTAITQTATFESDTCPMTPPCQAKWEESSDPWSYAESIHGLDEIERARKLNPTDEDEEDSPVGQRISSIIQGTKKHIKRMVPGAKGRGYEEFDDSSQTSDPIFEDDEENLSQMYPQVSEEHEVHDL